MASTVELRGFRGGNGTQELNDAESIKSVLKRAGIDSTGITVMLNETAISEADLAKITLRNGDVLRAAVKAVGGTDEAAEEKSGGAPVDDGVSHEAAGEADPPAGGDAPAQD